MHNAAADTLANTTARFTSLIDGFSIEIVYKPSVPNNVTNLHVFNDDQKVLDFLLNADVFKYAAIEEEDHDQALQKEQGDRKENPIPKWIMSLEKLFELQNSF